MGKLLRGKEIGAGEGCHWGRAAEGGGGKWRGVGCGGVIEKSAILPGRQATEGREERGGAVLLTCRLSGGMMNGVLVGRAGTLGARRNDELQ
jgi:hypothetical protein